MCDPGSLLVRPPARAGIAGRAVPGPARPSPRCVAGLPTDRFAFEGFLPAKAAARRDACRRWRRVAHAGVLRGAASPGGDAARHGGRARRRARGCSRARTDQAIRDVYRGTLGELARAGATMPTWRAARSCWSWRARRRAGRRGGRRAPPSARSAAAAGTAGVAGRAPRGAAHRPQPQGAVRARAAAEQARRLVGRTPAG